MAVEMVLNDLSLITPVDSQGFARAIMTELIEVLSTAKIYGIKTLRTQDNLYELLLAPDYPVSRWLEDSRHVEREERSFFLRELDKKTPLLAEINDQTIKENEELSDFKYQGKPAYALGVAYLLQAIAISFNSASEWDSDHLNLEITKLDNSTDQMILVNNTEQIVHASRRGHILTHQAWIESCIKIEPWQIQDNLLPCHFTVAGKCPISEWLDSIKDSQTREIIVARLNQVKRGILGDCKPITDGEGVCEMRIFDHAAHRIYYGNVAPNQLLLLCGGDKSTQKKDIINAKQYWRDHNSSKSTLGD
jgi:putative addiction module killer protein